MLKARLGFVIEPVGKAIGYDIGVLVSRQLVVPKNDRVFTIQCSETGIEAKLISHTIIVKCDQEGWEGWLSVFALGTVGFDDVAITERVVTNPKRLPIRKFVGSGGGEEDLECRWQRSAQIRLRMSKLFRCRSAENTGLSNGGLLE